MLSKAGQLEVALLFLDQLNTCEERLNEYLENQNDDRIKLLAHSLRGSSLAFDLPGLAAAWGNLETAVTNRETGLRQLSEEIFQLTLPARRELEGFVDRLRESGSEGTVP